MHTAMYAQTDTQSKAQMVFSNDFHDASGQLGNLTAHFITEKTWTDMNGEIGAIVRIKVTGMSVSGDVKAESDRFCQRKCTRHPVPGERARMDCPPL